MWLYGAGWERDWQTLDLTTKVRILVPQPTFSSVSIGKEPVHSTGSFRFGSQHRFTAIARHRNSSVHRWKRGNQMNVKPWSLRRVLFLIAMLVFSSCTHDPYQQRADVMKDHV